MGCPDQAVASLVRTLSMPAECVDSRPGHGNIASMSISIHIYLYLNLNLYCTYPYVYIYNISIYLHHSISIYLYLYIHTMSPYVSLIWSAFISLAGPI